MKREIKFRTPHFKFKDNMFSHFSYWGRINHKGESSDDCFTSPAHNNQTYTKEDQQFTGLKDKNGKEIYEGDICKKHYGSAIPVFSIAWHNERTMFIQHDGYNAPLFEISPILIEVIGNIYENPELL